MWVEEKDYDPERLPNGYTYENGRVTRRLTTSKRPESIAPEIWAMMNRRQKLEAVNRHERLARDAVVTVCVSPQLPKMLCSDGAKQVHRDKLESEHPLAGLALVARPVGQKELQTNKKAQAAMDAEWKSLKSLKTWDEETVAEWDNVRAAARRANKRVHVGRIFGLCVEKGGASRRSSR